MKKIVKRIDRIYKKCLVLCGLNKIIMDQNYKIILGYHHILPENDYRLSFLQSGMYVKITSFKQQIDYLVQNYRIVSLQEYLEMNDKRNICVITFDDGWVDNYLYAYPILKKYDIPATIFINTNLVNTNKWPWPDRISYYLRCSSDESYIHLIEFIKKNITRFKNAKKPKLGDKQRQLMLDNLINYFKNLRSDELVRIIEIIDQYMISMKEEISTYKSYLSWEQINEMAENGISFGAHTHNHIILTNLSTKEARNEILVSKEILSEKINSEINVFCYPNGNYNKDIVKLVQDGGFNAAVTTKNGRASNSDSPYELKRYMIHDDISNTIPKFASLII